jgi:hypothetical protein
MKTMQRLEPEGTISVANKKYILLHKFTWKRVGTVVGSNSSHRFGSIGTQTRPRIKKNYQVIMHLNKPSNYARRSNYLMNLSDNFQREDRFNISVFCLKNHR